MQIFHSRMKRPRFKQRIAILRFARQYVEHPNERHDRIGAFQHNDVVGRFPADMKARGVRNRFDRETLFKRHRADARKQSQKRIMPEIAHGSSVPYAGCAVARPKTNTKAEMPRRRRTQM